MHAYKFRCESFSIRSRFLRYLLKILYKKNYNNNKYIEIKTLVLFTMIIRSSNINWNLSILKKRKEQKLT